MHNTGQTESVGDHPLLDLEREHRDLAYPGLWLG